MLFLLQSQLLVSHGFLSMPDLLSMRYVLGGSSEFVFRATCGQWKEVVDELLENMVHSGDPWTVRRYPAYDKNTPSKWTFSTSKPHKEEILRWIDVCTFESEVLNHLSSVPSMKKPTVPL